MGKKKRTKRYPHGGAPSPKARGQRTNGTPRTRKEQQIHEKSVGPPGGPRGTLGANPGVPWRPKADPCL